MQQVCPELLSRLVINHVCDGIVLTDAEGLTVWVNPAFTRLSGYALSDLVGRRPGQVLQGPNTTNESKDCLADAIAARAHCKVDIINYSKAGNEYITEINLSPIFSEDGTLTHFVAVQRDVTSERALAQESTDFKAFQQALELQAIVSVTDARGRITYVNNKFCEISGYSSEELVGQTHRVVNSATHGRQFFKDMWKTIRTGQTWHGEVCNRTKSGALYWVDTTVVPVHGSRGEIRRYVSIRYDITSRKQVEFELVRQAETDALTGLANRSRFIDDLKRVLGESGATSDKMDGYLVMIDLDYFKDLNDSLGHHVGDLMLKETARRLAEFVGANGYVARLGGDEFAAIVPKTRAPDARQFIRELHEAACEPTSLDGIIYMPSFSMGVAEFPGDSDTVDGIMASADIALYEAKRDGRRTWRFHDPIVRHKREYRNRLKAIIETALESNSFEIVLQPFCHTKTRRHAGFEVLARLSHEGENITPDHFIPIAEEYGLIPAIGWRVFLKALETFKAMKHEGLDAGVIAVNVAAPQLREPGYAEDVLDFLLEYGVDASELVIEITETALIGRSKEVVAVALKQLREAGVQIALDDFGTGFSSLSHLRDFAVDKIKIDKSFVSDLEQSSEDQALVKGLADLARNLRLQVVAEGVETDAQAQLIEAFGCHYTQGYHHSRPLSVDDAMVFLGPQKTRDAESKLTVYRG